MLSQMTIDLLDEMTDAGLTDEAFGLAHHWRENGKRETIKHHVQYCKDHRSFLPDSTNERVYKRLRIMWECYQAYHGRNPAIFSKLAEAAYCLIPAGDARHPAATSF